MRIRARFFSHRLGPKLRAAVEQCLDAPEAEQLELFEELAIIRSLAGDAAEIHARAEALPDERQDKQQLLIAAGSLLSQQMEYIATVCEKAAKVSAMGKDKYSIHTLQDIINQVGRMVHSCFGHDVAGLMAFDKMLSEQLRLPVSQNQGTYRTPDIEATMMDDTIPSAPTVAPASQQLLTQQAQ